jgi:pimeloyl-ACP methyl ester carboxylesterase
MPTVELYHEQFGEGPDLVILHGLFGSGNNWRSFAKKLSKDYRISLVDLRNHGRSPHSEEMNYVVMLEDVFRFLEKHTEEKVTVLGHSIGGKTAMQLALRYPQKFRQLIVGDIAPALYTQGDSHRGYLQAMRNIPLNQELSRPEIEKILSESIPEIQIRAFLLKNLEINSDHSHWKINLKSLEDHLSDLMDFPIDTKMIPFEKPCIFFAGSKSNYIQAEHQPAMQHWFPKHRLVRLKNCGHWIHVDQPESLLKTLLLFFSAT